MNDSMDTTKGSFFRKADLHIHTPKSNCYSQKTVTPEQLVDAALAAGLEIIAITDHNTAEAVDEVRRVAAEKGLAVFPGIELSTRGGHVLALFDLDTPVEALDGFLDYVGVARTSRGDATVMTTNGIEEVLTKVQEQGGVGIAAHIERWPSGFLETNESRSAKARVHASSCVCALEITIAQNKPMWNGGLMRGYPTKRACIQGSDAHALVEIGRRPVYIQMERVCLDSLREAFVEYRTRVMFPDEPKLELGTSRGTVPLLESPPRLKDA